MQENMISDPNEVNMVALFKRGLRSWTHGRVHAESREFLNQACLSTRDTFQPHTAATGFAGMCTDVALTVSEAASVLSRVSQKIS